MLTSSVNDLVYWITERERIREKKAAGKPAPWSRNKTMQTVYFCNVHREDDKVTRWIRGFYSSFVFEKNFTANMMLARLVNKPESLADLGYMRARFKHETFRAVAEARKPFWGNAYVVTTHGQKMSKIDYAIGVLQAAFAAKLDEELLYVTHLCKAHEILRQHEGFGSFMAAQVVADLKNTHGHALADAPDWWTWSAPGPGSLRGLGWLFDRRVGVAQYDEFIALAWKRIQSRVPDMCMQDFQNCLCEYDKFMRVKSGTGRSKRKYNGEG